jgi:outer membrane immunogenic protein
MLKKLVLAAVAAVGLTGSAQAFDWSGFYVGVLGGFSVARDADGCSDCSVTLPGIAKVVGYNWDNGDIIYGLDEMFVVSFWPYDENVDVRKIEWQKLFRVGTEITDNVMIYGAVGGGIAYVSVDGSSDHLAYGAIAAGVEMALNENAIWRTHLQFSRSRNYDPCSTCYITAISIGTGLSWLL